MAKVIPLPDRAGADAALTLADRIAVFRWKEQRLGGIGRIVLHEDVPCEGGEHVDFVLVYKIESCWADWGLARTRSGVVLWSCADGLEISVFDDMETGLAAVSLHAGSRSNGGPAPGRTATAAREPAFPAPPGKAGLPQDRTCRIIAFPTRPGQKGMSTSRTEMAGPIERVP